MTNEEYYVRGCTALLDAVGGVIHHIGNIHKYARKPERKTGRIKQFLLLQRMEWKMQVVGTLMIKCRKW